MSNHLHGAETLTFDGFSGYYGSVPQGYGGFLWSDVDYLNASYWQNVKTNWCDTGYQNVVDGSSLAYSWGQQGEASYGYFGTENVKDTFSLVSMVAASAWETKQPFTFTSYVYHPFKGFVKKASITLDLSQTAQKIVFADLPNLSSQRADFRDISAVRITSHVTMGSKYYGNTCSYGADDPTTGNQLAFDDVTVRWNGKAPDGPGRPPAHPLLANLHHHGTPAAHHIANLEAAHSQAGANGAASHHASDAYHSELLSLPGHDPGGLTAQFQLPAVEHFGT